MNLNFTIGDGTIKMTTVLFTKTRITLLQHIAINWPCNHCHSYISKCVSHCTIKAHDREKLVTQWRQPFRIWPPGAVHCRRPQIPDSRLETPQNLVDSNYQASTITISATPIGLHCTSNAPDHCLVCEDLAPWLVLSQPLPHSVLGELTNISKHVYITIKIR